MSYFGFGLSSYGIELCDGVLTYQWFITKNKRTVFQGWMDVDGIDDVFPICSRFRTCLHLFCRVQHGILMQKDEDECR